MQDPLSGLQASDKQLAEHTVVQPAPVRPTGQPIKKNMGDSWTSYGTTCIKMADKTTYKT